jgi:hypothetical protein
MLERIYYIMGVIDFHCTFKSFFGAHLKHSSIWTLADVKPMQNDLVHTMLWGCMFYFLSACV